MNTILSYFTDKGTDLGNLPNVTQLARAQLGFRSPPFNKL